MSRMINPLPETGETERLVIDNAVMEDCAALQKICETWEDKALLEGSPFESDYIQTCLTTGDLPPIPGATKENYRFKSIRLKESGETIGFFDLYYGYPAPTTVWISMFVMDKACRKHGFAREAIEWIIGECKKSDYEKIGIGVHLKNWRGLRFWIKAGFNHAFAVYGDETYSEDTYALIGLERIIKAG
ncbi:GNAT family N-acetyltransferase [Paenibacillus sp. M1]|uniref:GNAT family N-acetyltransferase n=1 Tax=Paenibacillus haidiansis TaxID=1574488 RepID=A0ABU7VTD8_9BACL